MKPAEVLVYPRDDREAWIRGHVDEAAAQAAVDTVADRERVTSVSHVRGHYGLGVNEAGESVTGRLHLDATRTGPGWFPVTIATLRRVVDPPLPPLPDGIEPGSNIAMMWLQGAIRRRAGQTREEVPWRNRLTLAGWDAADAFYARRSDE